MRRFLVFTLTIILCFAFTTSSFSADELIYETFDNWKNPNVAEGWRTHSVGGWGGEFNQIYEAAQRITSWEGDATYFRSVYKDFPATPGEYYSVSFEPSWGNWFSQDYYVWLQFDDKSGNVISTHGGRTGIEYSGEQTFYTPGIWTNAGIGNYWKRQAALAPTGTDHMRVIFQVLSTGGSADFRKVTIYEATYTGLAKDAYGLQYGIFSFTPASGPYISRNTEFKDGKIANGWSSYTFGNFSGEYKMQPTDGSSQGLSAGGNSFSDFKSLYRDLKVMIGFYTYATFPDFFLVKSFAHKIRLV